MYEDARLHIVDNVVSMIFAEPPLAHFHYLDSELFSFYPLALLSVCICQILHHGQYVAILFTKLPLASLNSLHQKLLGLLPLTLV